MKEEIKTLAQYRISRAQETFEDALLLLQKGSLISAVNRLYYAAFYAARALLATKGVDSSKHSGVISLFQKHFVKTGMTNIDISKTFPRIFEKRVDADYEDFVQLTKEEVESIRDQTLKFINECERVLKEILHDSLK